MDENNESFDTGYLDNAQDDWNENNEAFDTGYLDNAQDDWNELLDWGKNTAEEEGMFWADSDLPGTVEDAKEENTTIDSNDKSDSDNKSDAFNLDYFDMVDTKVADPFTLSEEQKAAADKSSEAGKAIADTLTQIAMSNAANGNQLAYSQEDLDKAELNKSNWDEIMGQQQSKIDQLVNSGKVTIDPVTGKANTTLLGGLSRVFGESPTSTVLAYNIAIDNKKSADLEYNKISRDMRTEGSTQIPGVSKSQESSIMAKVNSGVDPAEAYKSVTGSDVVGNKLDGFLEGVEAYKSAHATPARTETPATPATPARSASSSARSASSSARSATPTTTTSEELPEGVTREPEVIPNISGPSLSTEATETPSIESVDVDVPQDREEYANAIGGTYDSTTGNITIDNGDGNKDIYTTDGNHISVTEGGKTSTVYGPEGEFKGSQSDYEDRTVIKDENGQTTTLDYTNGQMTIVDSNGEEHTYQAPKDDTGSWNFAAIDPDVDPEVKGQDEDQSQDEDTNKGQTDLEMKNEQGEQALSRILGDNYVEFTRDHPEITEFLVGALNSYGGQAAGYTAAQIREGVDNIKQGNYLKAVWNFTKATGTAAFDVAVLLLAPGQAILTSGFKGVWNWLKSHGGGGLTPEEEKELENEMRMSYNSIDPEEYYQEQSKVMSKNGYDSTDTSATNVGDYNFGMSDKENEVTSDSAKKIIKYSPYVRLAVSRW